MAVAAKEGRKEFSITWYIENFSFCWHKYGVKITSPKFTVDWIDDCVFYLTLYPRGDAFQADCVLFRIETTRFFFPSGLNFELSFLDTQGSVLHSYSYEKGNSFGPRFSICVKRDDVIVRRSADFLPQDTLTTRFRMWNGQGDLSEARQIFARTRIAVERISFFHTVENFSSLLPNEKRTVHMKQADKETPLMSMNVFITDGLYCEAKVVVEILFAKDQQVKYCRCDLSLLDAAGNRIEFGQGEAVSDSDQADSLRLVLSKSKRALLDKNKECLPKVVLTLRCECAFSTRIQFEEIEQRVNGLHLMPKSPPPSMEKKGNGTAKLTVCPSALDDLETLYKDQILSDVKLKTITGTFPAHKTVLCARSSVFRAMFQSDMREKTRECIEVQDLDDGTVRRFLLFLYTDHLGELQWDIATKLYYAADMYQVHRLKVECSSFLEDNLNSSNAIELLVLADMHQDSLLKTKVEDFIWEHDEEIFRLEMWENFMRKNPQLAVATMHSRYRKK